MYKVFFNDSTIQIGAEDKKSSKDNITQVVDFENHEFVNELIYKIESGGKITHFVLHDMDTNKLWECFKSKFTEIPAAGGLVRNSNNSLLFIKRLGVWDLPKGKIEKHETSENAAIREVEEECGISGLEIIRPLGSTYHIYRSLYLKFPDNLVLKETKWFLMSCEGDQKPVPQVEENIEEARWFAINNLNEILGNTYSSLHEFLTKSLTVI